MGVFILSEAEPRAREIAEYASKADHWYRYGVSSWVAADRPEHVLHSGTIKAVFTWTMTPGGSLFRHMSISSGGKLPHPYIVWTTAHYFGFTGAEVVNGVVNNPAEHWMMMHNEEQECIMVFEEVKDDRGREAASPSG